jgi:hypothetical protein
VSFVATAAAVILFSAAIVKTGRLAQAAGIAGMIVFVLLLILFGVGHLTMDIHGFGALMIAQGLWCVAVGVLLCRDAPPDPVRP